MTREEKDFIIDTLEYAIEWAEYASDYFQKKHDLKTDRYNVKKSIKLLKQNRTCENCIYRSNSGDFCSLWGDGWNFDDFCSRWEQK